MENIKEKSPKKNEFTEALNKELSSRKIFDKTVNTKKNDEYQGELFLEEFEDKLIPEKEPSEVLIQKNLESNSKEKNPALLKTDPTKQQEEPSIEKIEDKFEEKIFSEADDEFFDEPPLPTIIKRKKTKSEKDNLHSSVYHSKAMKKWEEAQEEENQESPKNSIQNSNDDIYRKLTRAEVAGSTISTLMLIYSITTFDKPLFFLSVSLITHLMRPLIGRLFGKYNRAVQSGLRSFSIVLFFGALILIFI